MTHHSHDSRLTSGCGYRRWVFWAFLLIAAYFLLTEHRAHFVQFLPVLLLLACPLLHLFHAHGGHAKEGDKDEAPAKKHGGCH